MYAKIAHVREVETISGLSTPVIDVIEEAVTILENEYGADQNLDHGDGGYVLVLESTEELAQLQDYRIDLAMQYLSISARFTVMMVRSM